MIEKKRGKYNFQHVDKNISTELPGKGLASICTLALLLSVPIESIFVKVAEDQESGKGPAKT